MSFFSKLFGRKAQQDPAQDLAVFRDAVIAKAKSMGARTEFKIAPDDASRIIMSRDGEVIGQADLTNAYNQFKVYPEDDAEEGIERLATIILANENDDAPFTLDDVVIVLRPEDYVNAVREQGGEVVSEPLMGELHKFYMVDTPQAMRGLTPSDIKDFEMSNVETAAIDNVRKWLPKLTADKSLQDTSLYYVEDNTFLTSSLILLDAFWDVVDAEYTSGCLFTLPRKDQLFVFDMKHQNALELAQNIVRTTFEDDFNLLSSQIFSRKNGIIGLVEAL
ncbi:MAG: DUF1444 family protein [Hellea sp.]